MMGELSFRMRSFCVVTMVIYTTNMVVMVASKHHRLNLRPVIGIVSQKTTEDFTPKIAQSDSYIAASYVKYMELAGRVILIVVSKTRSC